VYSDKIETSGGKAGLGMGDEAELLQEKNVKTAAFIQRKEKKTIEENPSAKA